MMDQHTLDGIYTQLEKSFEDGAPLDGDLSHRLQVLRLLPQGEAMTEACFFPTADDPPPLGDDLLSQLLDIPGSEAKTAPFQGFWSWLWKPGPALVLALALLAVIPFLVETGTEKGGGPPVDVAHILAMQIVTQGADGTITRRDPADMGQGTFAVPLSVGETLQLVLSSPEVPLDTGPLYALLIASRGTENPQILLENTQVRLQALPNTRSFYTLPKPMVTRGPPGKRRYYLILAPNPVDDAFKKTLLQRASDGKPMPLLTGDEARGLSMLEASLPLEVR